MKKINTTEILLFGLSADMLHKGHVKWISTLKKKFPNCYIILMPCSANPLGKQDSSGKIVYPTNGYIRWQMLYEYYQKHDPEIIVSQYEVAINIPSKTYDTIQYLRSTPIIKIKNQRGYSHPGKYNATAINQVTLVIGSDIVDEFAKWYAWDKILKTTKLIIIKRKGYEDLNLEKINHPQLKSALLNGIEQKTITLLKGPEINISSRKLKEMLQKNTKYQELLKYIPRDILTYIKKNQSEFSGAYYQNSLAQQTYDLAMQAYKEAVTEFDAQRQNKFSAFIADFCKMKNINNWQTEGYKLTNGRLEIDLNKIDTCKINKTIAKWMQENNCVWYQTKKPHGKLISPHQFNANFKLLGKYGPNLVIDLIIFIKSSTDSTSITLSNQPSQQEIKKLNGETLQLLTIKRNDELKTLAIPGGFLQEDILSTAVNELIEECFSNKLFAPNSSSSKMVNIHYQDKQSLFLKKLIAIINTTFANTIINFFRNSTTEANFFVDSALESSCTESSRPSLSTESFERSLISKSIPSNLYILEQLNLYTQQNPQLNPAEYIDYILSIINKNLKTNSQCVQIIAQFKCNLYKSLFFNEYKIITDFIKKNSALSPEEICITDARNTNVAWLVTRCIRLLISESEWQKLLSTCGLELSGGDDAASASAIPINDFFKDKMSHFAFHRYLVLRELAKLYESTNYVQPDKI